MEYICLAKVNLLSIIRNFQYTLPQPQTELFLFVVVVIHQKSINLTYMGNFFFKTPLQHESVTTLSPEELRNSFQLNLLKTKTIISENNGNKIFCLGEFLSINTKPQAGKYETSSNRKPLYFRETQSSLHL